MKIQLTKEVWFKINLYIDKAQGEISGLATSTYNPTTNIITVKDIGIWEQECTSGETEVNNFNDMILLTEELIERGAKPEEVNVWWHSHANMQAFFSGTDEKTIKDWPNNRYLLAIVGNKKGEFKAKMEVKSPVICQINDIPIEVLEDDQEINKAKEEVQKAQDKLNKLMEERNYYPDDMMADITAEVATKVKQKTYQISQSWPKKQYSYTPPSRKKYKNMSPWEKTNKEKEWAAKCLCDECWEYTMDTLKIFPFNTHNYDKKNDKYIPKSLEQRQLGNARVIGQEEKMKEAAEQTHQ